MPASLTLLIPTHLEAAGLAPELAKDTVVSGPGKVNAAVATTRICLEQKPDILLVWGLAGGLAQGLQRGDMVVADTLYQHDFNIAPLMDCVGPGHVPGLPLPHWPCHLSLADIAEKAILKAAPAQRIWRGPIATGDQFISGQQVQSPGTHHHAPPLAVDMESAAIWQTLHRLQQDGIKTPQLVVLRTLSDSACEAAAGDFEGFLKQFEGRTGDLLPHIIHALTHPNHA